MPRPVSISTTRVPMVTGPVKVLDSLFRIVSVFNGIAAPNAPSTVTAAVLPPLRVKLRVLAVSPSTV